MATKNAPPVDPNTDEADARQLGNEVGSHEHPLLWHPMLYHYGRNWKVPANGDYMLKVRVEPPTVVRHDDVKQGDRRDDVRQREGRARAGLTAAAALSRAAP